MVNQQEIIAQMRDAAHKARILDFIESLPDGFQTLVGDNGIQLSGGQRQRGGDCKRVI